MTRKQKTRLSFEMLQRELNTLMPQELLNYNGGTGGISGDSVLLENGYCVFNALSHIFTGGTGNAQEYVDDYEEDNPNTAVYDNGTLMGYQFTATSITNLMAEEGGAAWGVSQITDGNIAGIISAGGGVMMILPDTGPNGEDHAVVITSINADGTLNYYDPTSGDNVPNYSGSTGMAFGATRQAW